jgi:hypothetical protein
MQKFKLHLKLQESTLHRYRSRVLVGTIFFLFTKILHSIQDAVGHYSAMKLAQVQGYSSLKSPSKSKWVFVRDILNAVVLFAGAAYSLRYLYR